MSKKTRSLLVVFALLFGVVVSAFLSVKFSSENVMADEHNSVHTTMFGNFEDDGQGCGVYMVLNLVLDILTYGISIAGVLGIVVSGIMYLTSKGNEQQQTKSKRRITEIVIGLATYAVLFVGLNFILPSGAFNNSTTCAQSNASTNPYERQAPTSKPSESGSESPSESGSSSTSYPSSGSDPDTSSGGSSSSSSGSKKKTNAEIQKELAETAIKIAWPHSKKSKSKNPAPGFMDAFKASGVKQWEKDHCKKKPKSGCNSCRQKGKSCSDFVATVVRTVIEGERKKYPNGFPTPAVTAYKYLKKSKNWKSVSAKNIQPGDVEIQVSNGAGQHIAIIVKGKGSKATSAEASNCDFYGRVNATGRNPAYGRTQKYFRYVGN